MDLNRFKQMSIGDPPPPGGSGSSQQQQQTSDSVSYAVMVSSSAWCNPPPTTLVKGKANDDHLIAQFNAAFPPLPGLLPDPAAIPPHLHQPNIYQAYHQQYMSLPSPPPQQHMGLLQQTFGGPGNLQQPVRVFVPPFPNLIPPPGLQKEPLIAQQPPTPSSIPPPVFLPHNNDANNNNNNDKTYYNSKIKKAQERKAKKAQQQQPKPSSSGNNNSVAPPPPPKNLPTTGKGEIKILQRPSTSTAQPLSSSSTTTTNQTRIVHGKKPVVKQVPNSTPLLPTLPSTYPPPPTTQQQQPKPVAAANNSPKKPPKAKPSRRNAEEAARERIESIFKNFLSNPRVSVTTLAKSPQDHRLLTDLISFFMNYLRKRVSEPDASYLDIADKRHDDYAFYDDRLLEAIRALYQPNVITEYESILDRYRNLHPPSVWRFRQKLRAIKEDCHAIPELVTTVAGSRIGPIDFRMVTYQTVNPVRLYKILSTIDGPTAQLGYFLKEIGLSPAAKSHLDRFVATLGEALKKSPFGQQLDVQLFPFGSLSNGLGTFDSDLDIVLKFRKVLNNEDRLDYETCMLILKVVRILLQKKLGFRSGDLWNCIVPSKRCPIIKLDFGACCGPAMKSFVEGYGSRDPTNPGRPLAFNHCDISVTSIYGVYNSAFLKFLTEYDRRFQEMTLLLKFWAKKNALISTEAFSSYAFTMMIAFYLQNTTPPILPPICKLQELAQGKRKPIRVHGWSFEFLDNPAQVRQLLAKESPNGVLPVNCSTTVQLIPGFFRYYRAFNYAEDAICPRLGVIVKKAELYAEKERAGLGGAFKQTSLVVEDPFVLEHNPGSIFHDHYWPKWSATLERVLDRWRIDEHNAVLLLTDPERWDPSAPPKELGRDSKEAQELRKRLKKVQQALAKGARVAKKLANGSKKPEKKKRKKTESTSDQDESEEEEEEVVSDDVPNGTDVDQEQPAELDARIPVDYKMISYEMLDKRQLHQTVISHPDARTKLTTLLAALRLPPETKSDLARFVAALQRAIDSTEPLREFAPRVEAAGSMVSGLGLYNADLNLVVHLDAVAPRELVAEFDIAKIVLKIVQSVLQHRLGFERKVMKREKTSVSSRKRAVMPLNFASSVRIPIPPSANRKYNRFDISIGLAYAEPQAVLLRTMSQLDRRFMELTLVLKYWAKMNGVINADLWKQSTSYSSYAFTMLVMFYCQRVEPPVLPAVERVMVKKREEVPKETLWTGKYSLAVPTDPSAIDFRSENTATTEQLLVDFFRYYSSFNYESDVISPRLGTTVTRKSFFANGSNTRGFRRTEVAIEDPLVHDMNLVGEGLDSAKWVAVLKRFLARGLTAENVLDVLVDPALFQSAFASGSGASSKSQQQQSDSSKSKKGPSTTASSPSATISPTKTKPSSGHH